MSEVPPRTRTKRLAKLALPLLALIALLLPYAASRHTSELAQRAALFSSPAGCHVFSRRAFAKGEEAPAFAGQGYDLQFGCNDVPAGKLQDEIEVQLRALHYSKSSDTRANPDQVLQATYQDATTVVAYQIGTQELATRDKLQGTQLSLAQQRTEHASSVDLILYTK